MAVFRSVDFNRSYIRHLLGGSLSSIHLFSVFSLALGIRKTDLLCYPVAPFVVLSVTATLINSRISWRGTFYPLSNLKR